MTIERKLSDLFNAIRDEAQQNNAFRDRLAIALHSDGAPAPTATRRVKARDLARVREAGTAADSADAKRGNRRARALVDPIAEIPLGETHLRTRLESLDLEQLRDVVAEYRMDPNKLVMKWKDRERVISHIVATAVTRGRKGDAFRA